MIKTKFRAPKALRVSGVCACLAALATIGSVSMSRAQEHSSLGAAYPGAPTPEQRNQLLQNGDGEVHVLPVRPGKVYMLWGGGGNITAQVGADGVLIINSGSAPMSDKILAALHSISNKPLRYIIDTDVDAKDAGGNLAIAKTGSTVTGGNVVGNIGASAGEGATVIAAQQVLDRMSTSGSKDMQPDGAWPTDTYSGSHKDIWFNGESIRVMHIPAAHTDGDSFVYLRLSDVVSAGNIFSTTSYPVIDLDRGGSIQGIIDGLNKLVYEITIPGPQNGGGTLVIPNSGRIGNQSDVVYYQEMVIIIRDRIQNMISKGMTLDQIKAAKPTFDYDPRYGSTTGPWTTDMFVEAVYKSLMQKPSPPAGDSSGQQ